MKVIFTDTDGVLNSMPYLEEALRSHIKGIISDVDPKKIELLKQAVDKTDAKVVLTSSWRYRRNAANLIKLLEDYEIYPDLTPFISNKRGLEIYKWLEDNKNIEDFVILDDDIFDTYDDKLKEKLILTSPDIGLLPDDIDMIVERLGNKNKVI